MHTIPNPKSPFIVYKPLERNQILSILNFLTEKKILFSKSIFLVYWSQSNIFSAKVLVLEQCGRQMSGSGISIFMTDMG